MSGPEQGQMLFIISKQLVHHTLASAEAGGSLISKTSLQSKFQDSYMEKQVDRVV